MNRDPQIAEALESFVPLRADELADWAAVLAEAGPPRSSRRRLRWILAAVVVVGALVLGFAWPFGSGGSGPLDRALAAMGDRPVLHAVLRVNLPGVVVDLASGKRSRPYMVLEHWYEPDEGLRERVLESTWLRAPSRVVVEQGASEAYTNVFGAFLRGYEDALRRGDAQIVRRGQIGGREVEWWRFDDSPVGMVSADVAIDSETYRPLVVRLIAPGRRPVLWSARVLEIGTVAELPDARPSTEGVFGIDVKQGLTPKQAAGALSKPTFWVGPEYEGLPLAHIKLLEFAQGPRKTWESVNERWKGLSLTYGEVDEAGIPVRGKPSLSLEEQTKTGALEGAPPEGMVLLIGRGATMQKDGVYINITASSRELALSAAQALEPIPAD